MVASFTLSPFRSLHFLFHLFNHSEGEKKCHPLLCSNNSIEFSFVYFVWQNVSILLKISTNLFFPIQILEGNERFSKRKKTTQFWDLWCAWCDTNLLVFYWLWLLLVLLFRTQQINQLHFGSCVCACVCVFAHFCLINILYAFSVVLHHICVYYCGAFPIVWLFIWIGDDDDDDIGDSISVQ